MPRKIALVEVLELAAVHAPELAIATERAGIDAHRDIPTASFDGIRGGVLDRPAAGCGRAADKCKCREEGYEMETSLTPRARIPVTHHRDTIARSFRRKQCELRKKPF